VPQLRRQARLARIAGALASGATVTEIAEDEGISRALASRETNSPECLQLIAEFVDAEHELMVGLCYRAVRVIEEAFEARREYTTRLARSFRVVRTTTPGSPRRSTCAIF
jgi:hypothetical protein